jgi:hypothetical protein
MRYPKCQVAEADSELEKLAILAAVSNKGDDAALWAGSTDGSRENDESQALRPVRFFFEATNEAPQLPSLAKGYAGGGDSPSWMPEVSIPKQERRGLSCSNFQTATVQNAERVIFSDWGEKTYSFLRSRSVLMHRPQRHSYSFTN